MLNLSTILTYYKRADVQNELVEHAKNREVAIRFGDKGFGKRPDVLNYPLDVLELAKQGATSMHASEERWRNPLQLDPMLRKQELEALRTGWDLVIDIDCPYFEYSKIAADLIVKALRHHRIKSISVKFSGNKGFHIGVPFEAFPERIADEETCKRFPEATRGVAAYLKNMVKGVFAAKIMGIEGRDINKIAENLNKKKEELVMGNLLNADAALDIDTLLISSRHLYRMPYSLHEKSGLASVPVELDRILEFKREDALPSKVVVRKELRFLDRENVIVNEAGELFDRAITEAVHRKDAMEFKLKEMKEFDIPETAIPEQFFPPCIKLILNGLSDGKKRSLFILTNFLVSVGWGYDEIEKLLHEWNKKNNEPLREVLLVGQIRYHKQQKKKILPPNCNNMMYYKDFGVCKPDNLCFKIKNPVSYSRRKTAYLNKENKPSKEVKQSKSNKEAGKEAKQGESGVSKEIKTDRTSKEVKPDKIKLDKIN